MARTPVGFKRLLMRERRPALTESEHVSRCATSVAREPRSQLLGGFAGQIGPKRRNTPAFSQVGEADSRQHPPKTTQKFRAMEKSAPFSCEPIQNPQGRDRGQGRSNRSASAGATRSIAGHTRRRSRGSR